MRVIPIAMLLVLTIGLLAWLAVMPSRDEAASPATTRAQSATQPVFRLGLIPERDIYHQRHIYRAMADYIGSKLHRPVELVTASQYRGILLDLAENRIDAAFMGSLVTTLAVDRMGVKILASPELDLKVTTYYGVLFVPESSPITTVDQLRGKSVVMARATTGGSLYGVYELARRGLLDKPDAPKILSCGSHDDAIYEVLDGRADDAVVKDIRHDDFEKNHPKQKFRRLASGEAVPENAFVLRAELADLAPQLTDILMHMDQDPEGREALKTYGATRFRPCSIVEYKAIFDMIDKIGHAWDQVGLGGPPPKRQAELTTATTRAAASPGQGGH